MGELISEIKNNRRYFIITLLLFFVFLSILAVLPFWSTGFIYSGPDMQFHTSRIQEIVASIKQGSFFPHIATHTFNNVGDMVISSYPWITLYPYALFMLIFPPITAIYMGNAFYIFLTLCLSYFSMYKISDSRKISFYFAILYGYTSFFIFNVLDFQFGTFLAYGFFPLALCGLYLIMFKDYKQWYILTLGVIGVMYSHTPSTLILIYTLTILYGVLFRSQVKSERKNRFKYLLLSAFTTLLLSLIVWGPIINMLLNQKVDKPQPQMLTNGSEDFSHILFNTFSNYGYNGGIGIAIVLILVLGWLYLKRVPLFARHLYYAGLVTIFIISIIFPWYLIHYIPLVKVIEGIQLTERIYPIAILFLSGYGAYLLASFDLEKNYYSDISKFTVLIIIIAGWFSGVAGIYMNGMKDQQELNYVADFGKQVPKNWIGLEWYKVNDSEYYNQFGEENATGMTDYVPLNASGDHFGSIAFHNLNYGDQYVKLSNKLMHPGVDSMTYESPVKLEKGIDVNLPFIYYSGVKYLVTVNGMEVPYSNSSNRNTIRFNMPFTASNAIIKVEYLGSFVNNASFFISILTWLVLICYFVYLKYNLKNKKGGLNND